MVAYGPFGVPDAWQAMRHSNPAEGHCGFYARLVLRCRSEIESGHCIRKICWSAVGAKLTTFSFANTSRPSLQSQSRRPAAASPECGPSRGSLPRGRADPLTPPLPRRHGFPQGQDGPPQRGHRRLGPRSPTRRRRLPRPESSHHPGAGLSDRNACARLLPPLLLGSATRLRVTRHASGRAPSRRARGVENRRSSIAAATSSRR
jgi:hypothetical protein